MEYKGENTNACSNIYDDKQISSSSSSRDDNSDRIGLIKRTTPLHIVWPHRWYKCINNCISIAFQVSCLSGHLEQGVTSFKQTTFKSLK